jgi:hypothetical protein
LSKRNKKSGALSISKIYIYWWRRGMVWE